MKVTTYLFPDRLSGYGPLTSKLILLNGNGGMSVSCKGALICLALRVSHGMQLFIYACKSLNKFGQKYLLCIV